MSLTNLLAKIDAVKEKLSDNEYKTLCDEMNELYTKEKQETGCYYIWFFKVVTYIEPSDELLRSEYALDVVKQIVKMSKAKFEEMSNAIETNNSHTALYDFGVLEHHNDVLEAMTDDNERSAKLFPYDEGQVNVFRIEEVKNMS